MDVLFVRLFGAGFLRRFQVDGPGKYSVRGGIVDIYAPDMQKPHRLEFWGDEVDSIHSFDLVSQRREGAVKKIYLSPAREVLFGATEAAARLLPGADNVGAVFDKPRQEIVLFVETAEELTMRTVRKELRGAIPAYMLPSLRVTMPQLAHNAIDKLDRVYLAKWLEANCRTNHYIHFPASAPGL